MYYTVEEIAEKLKLNPETIRRYIRAGDIEVYKFGREFRIDEEAFEKFLESRISKKKA